MSKISIEEVKERLTSFGIEMLSENYMGMRKKHLFKCKECGEPFEAYMKHVMYENKHICNICSNKKVSEKYKGKHLVFDYENLLERLNNLNLKMKYPKKYKIEDMVTFICECGNEFTTKLKYVLYKKKSKCDECTSKKVTNEEFINKVYEKVQDEYTFLEEYNGTKFPIKVRHNKCGYEYKVAPYNFVSMGHRCLKCGKQLLKTLELVKEECLEIHPDKEYEVLSMDREGKKSRLTIIHNKCNHIFEMNYAPFIQHNGKCPKCFGYKGEVRILKYLEENNIKYKPQYTFEDCRYIKKLPFDFAIFDENDNLKCLIEFQGRQHYEVVRFNGIDLDRANIAYQKVIRNDKIKELYCKENNIKLIRIPYTEFENIEKILKI